MPRPSRCYKKALAITEKALGPEHPDVATSLNNLAALYESQGRYAEAEPLYKRALAIREKALGPEHPDVATSLNNLAVLYRSRAAMPRPSRCIKRVPGDQGEGPRSRASRCGREPQQPGRALSRAGPLRRGRAALSRDPWRSGEKALGPEHPDVAASLNNLAVLYESQGRYAEAEPLYKKSLAIVEKALGPEHPGRGHEPQQPGRALPMPRAAMPRPSRCTRKPWRCGRRPWVRSTRTWPRASTTWPGSTSAQGRYAEAEPLYKKSLAIWEKALGPEHPDVALSLNNLAGLYRDQQKPGLEQPLRRRVQRIDAERLTQGLIGKQGEGMTGQRGHALPYLHLLARLESPGAEDRADALSAVQLARRAERGAAFQLLAQRLAAGGSGELAALVRERQDLIQQLTALENELDESYGLPADERPDGLFDRLREEVEALQQKESAISERLQREFPAYAEFEGSRLADLASLQQVLRPEEAALAWVLGDEESYLLIVPREGDLQIKALAVTEEQVAEQVQQLHRALDLADPEHYGELAPFPAAVAAQLFGQLFGSDWQNELKGVERLLLVPEGPLTRLAFPVLLTEPPQQAELAAYSREYQAAPWLVRRFAVSVLPSLSALTALRGEAGESQATEPFLGVGDPLLDDHPAETRGAAKAQAEHLLLVRDLRGAAQLQPPPASPSDIRRLRLELIRQKLFRLPDTAEELQRIAQLLRAGDQALLLREAATEQRVKQTPLDAYGIVSFATHGVLAGELGRGIEPGLVLTPPPEATEEDDGFLALSEVARLNLNADWVVLSACNTGAGADQGEGLTGLAKAFTYAGAKALLVSHWAVGSAATVELMEQLFRGYREKQLSRAEAHRQAMLAMIGSGDPLFRHPSLWAPFVVVGDGR